MTQTTTATDKARQALMHECETEAEATGHQEYTGRDTIGHCATPSRTLDIERYIIDVTMAAGRDRAAGIHNARVIGRMGLTSSAAAMAQIDAKATEHGISRDDYVVEPAPPKVWD